MKVDLCMWAKNGARFLPVVLRRIDKVIPNENVNQKIFVDDSSIDDSIQIAKDFNWSVYTNKEGFVAGGVKEALSHIKSELFIGIEQDVILNLNWFDKIPPYMFDPKVAIASGARVPTHPVLREIKSYWYANTKDVKGTLDNTIFRTKVIRQIGIPDVSVAPISVDRYLHSSICELGYKWIVDKKVVSDHIRFGLIEEERHFDKLSKLARLKTSSHEISMFKMFRLVGTSPIRGLHIAFKSKRPLTLPYYVYQRLTGARRLIHRKRQNNVESIT